MLVLINEFEHFCQVTEDMEIRYLPEEEAEQSRPIVSGSLKEPDTCDAPQAPSQLLQPPLSFMDSLMPPSNDGSISSPQLGSDWLSDLHQPSEVPLMFGLLPVTPVLQGSVSGIQIGSIPLHVPQQVVHPTSIAPMIQFGQLAHPPSLLQPTPFVSQSTLAATVSTQVQAQIADSASMVKVNI